MRLARIDALVCCAGLLWPILGANAQHFDHSYAIVIGIDDYAHPTKYSHLNYAERDAKAMAALLQNQGFSVTPLYGINARKASIISAMEDDLARKVGVNDRVLVFFAGHGKTETLGGEKRGYIVPYDGDASSSLISMEELRQQSSYMGNARHQLFILDSCFGGILAGARDSIVDPKLPGYLKEVTDRTGRQVLTAGGEGQQVLDGGPKGHSIFMDALLEGLQDGLADWNGDGYITFHELVAYVTPRASNDFQTPDEGELPRHQGGEFLFKNPKGAGRAVTAIPVPIDTGKRSGAPAMSAKQYIALGDARWNVSDWDGAATQYREAIGVDPNDAEAHFDLGDALYRRGDGVGAIQETREAIRLKPDYAEAHNNLGAALGGKGDWDGEVKEEREAIRLKPDFAEAHNNLGVALGQKGDWDGEIKEVREAIRLKPDMAEAHDNLGYALEEKGDSQAALAEYRRALDLKPDLADAQSRYDALLKKMNKPRSNN